MITYELAKELKNAGFKQKGKGEFINEYGLAGVLTTDVAYSPTLSELILELGNTLRYIENGDEWIAGGHSDRGIGKSPEEAVARLWLMTR